MKFRDSKRVDKVLLDAIQAIEANEKIRGIFASILLDIGLYGHSSGTARIAIQIGIYLGIDEDKLLNLAIGGLLHDVGKLRIDPKVFYKPTRLTDEEFDIIKKHPAEGHKMLVGVGLSQDILDMVRYHHEKTDGSGYGTGTRDINMLVQIITVADITSALTEPRCYHAARTVEETLNSVKNFIGINQNIVSVLGSLISD